MKTQHTPGPWVVDNKWEALTIKNIREMPMGNGTIEETILEISQGFVPNSKNIALIAAAPEMLEALETALRLLAVAENNNAFKDCALPLIGQKTIKQIESVLNKAKGE